MRSMVKSLVERSKKVVLIKKKKIKGEKNREYRWVLQKF